MARDDGGHGWQRAHDSGVPERLAQRRSAGRVHGGECDGLHRRRAGALRLGGHVLALEHRAHHSAGHADHGRLRLRGLFDRALRARGRRHLHEGCGCGRRLGREGRGGHRRGRPAQSGGDRRQRGRQRGRRRGHGCRPLRVVCGLHHCGGDDRQQVDGCGGVGDGLVAVLALCVRRGLLDLWLLLCVDEAGGQGLGCEVGRLDVGAGEGHVLGRLPLPRLVGGAYLGPL
mmetsp:Transcript_72752/g.210635  ORF Transcript_72752/g.210635 Transcript_72752/m.210635 type:complete len:229 (+) Transcript_72752:469-1155(+)